jgi:hypothetical protein
MTNKQLYKFVFVMTIITTLALSFSATINGLILQAIGVFSLGVVTAVSQLMLLETEAQDD